MDIDQVGLGQIPGKGLMKDSSLGGNISFVQTKKEAGTLVPAALFVYFLAAEKIDPAWAEPTTLTFKTIEGKRVPVWAKLTTLTLKNYRIEKSSLWAKPTP